MTSRSGWRGFVASPMLKIGQTDHGNRDGEELLALNDVSFTVEQGEVLGIIGRNGAGKSTLLKILSRVTSPTTGKVKVKGRIASLLEVGTGFHPELTGRENIYLNGAILGMSRKEINRKFDEIVDFAEVEQFVDTPVKRYSSGMYVRLAFAVAAHLEPEILLVDEVLAVGDAEFQKKCLGKMSDIAEQGRTVLFVSHNMAAIQQLCSRTIVIMKGSICYQGQNKSAIENYFQGQIFRKERNIPQMSEESSKFFLSSLSFINNNHQEVNAYQTGDDIIIKLDFHSIDDIENLIVTIGINDQFGTRITLLHSALSGYKLRQLAKESSVICHTRNIWFMPGKYTLDIRVYKSNESILWLENIADLFIEPGDVFKTGKLPPKEWGGYFVVNQEWII
jgi:lipopolysaccharide transport system ATP-binding protein